MPNYVQYFGSNIVEGVAESWVEAEMSWVEVGGGGWSWVEVGARFSNTHLFILSPFLRNLIGAKLKEFGYSQNQILVNLKTFSTRKGIHTWNEIRLSNIPTWCTLLMPCLTICKRQICHIPYKFMMKVRRFSASKKSGVIMYN